MQRRTFLSIAAASIQGAVALVVAIPVLRFLMHPLRQRRSTANFVRVGPLEAVPADKPLRVTVSADRRDAFVHYPPGPVGRVWLVRDGPDVDAPVRCFQSLCPHLGCGIDYAVQRGAFICPCHASEFDSLGRRRFGPAPRDMDELACRVTEPDERGRRWVEVVYEEFQTGTPERRPRA